MNKPKLHNYIAIFSAIGLVATLFHASNPQTAGGLMPPTEKTVIHPTSTSIVQPTSASGAMKPSVQAVTVSSPDSIPATTQQGHTWGSPANQPSNPSSFPQTPNQNIQQAYPPETPPHDQQTSQSVQEPTATGGGLMAPTHVPTMTDASKPDPIQKMIEQMGKVSASTKQEIEDIGKLNPTSLAKKKTDLLQEQVNKATDLDQAYTELKRLESHQGSSTINPDAVQVQLYRIMNDIAALTSINVLMGIIENKK